MRLVDLVSKLFPKKKTTQFKHDSAYRFLVYLSADNSVMEIIWNGTNLLPPDYVLDKSKQFKLYFDSATELSPQHKPKAGERYFSYKTPEKYIQERTPMLEFCWKANMNNCQKMYSSWEEFFAVSCRNMDKPRIELVVQS